MLQETRPNHDAQETEDDISWDELCAMSYEELQEYGRSLGLKDGTWSAPHFNCRIAC
jgi:hypothetical protein